MTMNSFKDATSDGGGTRQVTYENMELVEPTPQMPTVDDVPTFSRTRSCNIRRSKLSIWMGAVVLLTLSNTSMAFVHLQSFTISKSSPSVQSSNSACSSLQQHRNNHPSKMLLMSFQDVSDFYQNFPLQSAILTCGFKASVADSLAQFKDSLAKSSSKVSTNLKTKMKNKRVQQDSPFNWELRRNLAYVIYGGIFVGMMCHLEYNILFPRLFGMDHSFTTILAKVVFDDFVSAPLVWLPPAYLIKAWLYDYSMKEGLQKYWRDIRENDLLIKYWTVWLPAQTVSFSVVPDHLRVAFMASVSFFWFILFSSVTHDEGAEVTTGSTVIQPNPCPSTANSTAW